MRIEESKLSYVTAHRSTTETAMIDRAAGRTPRSRSGLQLPAADTVQLSGVSTPDDSAEAKSLLILIVEQLSGQKFKGFGSGSTSGLAPTHVPAGVANPSNGRLRVEIHFESEHTGFKAQGVVETADGRSIRFAAQIDMQRESLSSTVVSDPAQSKDPLVVNFGGGPTRVTAGKISFDLNADGNPESISFVAGGSGFLVLDGNGDEKVNDGREMFGPRTGNGFGELAAYDADGNGWIDENDPVYSRLRIWSQNGLSTLSEKGVGAIATSSADTPFALKDSANKLQGEVRSTGIYLAEDGVAGTVQQVDLATD